MAAAATKTTASESGNILTKSNDSNNGEIIDDLSLSGRLLASKPAGAGTKRKEASSASSSDAGDDHDERDPKRNKEASASEDNNKKEEEGDSLFEEGEMLREELWEAERLWSDSLVPGAFDHFLEVKEKNKKKTTSEQAPATSIDDNKKKNNKKKKVVRIIIDDGFIPYILENPYFMRELSDEEMAECPEEYRQTYAINKLINEKSRAYQQAIIDQYRAFGFAYDEKEVTDDEDEGEEPEVAVVKN